MKAVGKRSDPREETPLTPPEQPSAVADSVSPLAELDTGGVAEISADPSLKIDPVLSHTQSPTTPVKSFAQDMHEETELRPKEPAVSFEQNSDRVSLSAVSNPAIASIASDPMRLSRRSKARSSKSEGRTSESFSRADNAFIRWENAMYDSLFADGPNGDPTAIVPITLASGRYIKQGEPLDKSLVDTHIKQLREDLSFEDKEAILKRYLKPPDKPKRAVKEIPPRKSRRRNPGLADDSDSEDDNRLMSTIGTTTSNVSKHSDEVSKHSTTMDPENKDGPMQSPIHLHAGRFIHRREHILSAQHTSMRAVITGPEFFRQEVSNTDFNEVTLIDRRRPFAHTKDNQYPFEEVTWRAFRVMMCDCVAHWRGGLRLEDIILWAFWTPAFRKDFLRLWQAQVADSVHHPHRKDGRYIELYGNFDEQHFSSMTASNILYPLFICLEGRRVRRETAYIRSSRH